MDNLYTIFTNVYELHKNNFQYKNKKWYFMNKEQSFKNKYGFVVFYSPQCSHCKYMKDFWSELAIKFNNLIFFSAVNCKTYENESIIFDLPIEVFPVVFWIDQKTRRLIRYTDRIEYDNIQQWIYRYI
jgi:thiol-disulfide isomerase/thioredoxin